MDQDIKFVEKNENIKKKFKEQNGEQYMRL